MAEEAGNIKAAKERVVEKILKTGSITAAFEIQGTRQVTYSNIQHTFTESRYVLAN